MKSVVSGRRFLVPWPPDGERQETTVLLLLEPARWKYVGNGIRSLQSPVRAKIESGDNTGSVVVVPAGYTAIAETV